MQRVIKHSLRLEIDRCMGFTDIAVSAKTTDFIASVGVDKTLLYSSCIQTTLPREQNEPSQDSDLVATLAGVFS